MREKLERQFEEVTEWLLFGLLDFDYICESLLQEMPEGNDGKFQVGEMAYDAVVVPGCVTLRRETPVSYTHLNIPRDDKGASIGKLGHCGLNGVQKALLCERGKGRKLLGCFSFQFFRLLQQDFRYHSVSSVSSGSSGAVLRPL